MPSQANRERALVGLFVLLAAGLLVATLFSLTGFFRRHEPVYTAYFNDAGGLAPGAEVRYAGGPPVGRVVSVRSDPKNPARMEVRFRVERSVPVKTDSKAVISSLSALGDNFLGIVPGSAAAARARSGAVLPSLPYSGFATLAANFNALAPQVNVLVQNLNGRVTQLAETLRRVNLLLDDRNRSNISASLADVHGLLAEDRPALHSTLNNLQGDTAKLAPVIDDFKKTIGQANRALSHIDQTILENRPDLRQAIEKLRETLASTAQLSSHLNDTVDINSDNIDQIIANITQITENLQDFTQTIKTRPYSLIRSTAPPPHKPGEPEKPQP